MRLEHYAFEKAQNDKEWLSQVENILQGENFQGPFHQVSVAFINDWFTLIPKGLFEKEESANYLNFNLHYPQAVLFASNSILNSDSVLVYAMPQTLKEMLEQRFVNLNVFHHAQAFLENSLQTEKNQAQSKAYVLVRPEAFELIIIKEGQLHFMNSFPYQSSEDFMYYLLYSLEQLQLPVDDCELILQGAIEKDSGIYELLHKYIAQLRFANPQDSFYYSPAVRPAVRHQYLNLFSQYLCA